VKSVTTDPTAPARGPHQPPTLVIAHLTNPKLTHRPSLGDWQPLRVPKLAVAIREGSRERSALSILRNIPEP
jgi:hypothetical protein